MELDFFLCDDFSVRSEMESQLGTHHTLLDPMLEHSGYVDRLYRD